MTRTATIVLSLMLLGAGVAAWHLPLRAQPTETTLSGELARDLATLPLATQASFLSPPVDDDRPTKSVALAVSLSAILPGSGQLYAEAPWWRVALYGTLEAAGWITYGVYTHQGDVASGEFVSYADAHWDVERYVEWIRNNYMKWGTEGVDRQAASEALALIYRTSDPNIPSWDRVDFEQLNKLERSVKGGFSHTLPRHGDQQYYEEVGKYVQYRSGWDDHAGGIDSAIYDPGYVTSRNQEYTIKREHANDLLTYADYAVTLVILNHITSLIDAGLAAKSYNISLRPHLREGSLPSGERFLIETRLSVQVHF